MRYRRLATTIDDAAGEAFDKTAKLLGLGFPGGPAVEKAAALGDPARFTLPRPLKGKPGCDFSFSGLKNAARLLIESLPQPLSEQDQSDVARAFQDAVADAMADRVRRGVREMKARQDSPGP